MTRIKQISLLFAILLLGVATAASASSTVLVTGADVGVSWFTNDTRTGGTVDFVAGPASTPLGIGSLQMTSTDAFGSSQAKAQLFTYAYGSFGTPGDGVSLSDIDGISYATYRDSASTNSTAQTISLNMEVDFVGDGSSFTTLVFEPIYNGYQGPMLTDTWQMWDAFDNGNAIWWSTRALPGGICAFNCFVSWNTILANNPNAEVKFGFGYNIGSGWVGQFNGYADALTFSVAGDATTYDFEPYEVATDKDACKNGGWENLRRADGTPFKNQGDCIQYVNTGK